MPKRKDFSNKLGKIAVTSEMIIRWLDNEIDELVKKEPWASHEKALRVIAEALAYEHKYQPGNLDLSMVQKVEELYAAKCEQHDITPHNTLFQQAQEPAGAYSDWHEELTLVLPAIEPLPQDDFAPMLCDDVAKVAKTHKWSKSRRDRAGNYLTSLIKSEEDVPAGIGWYIINAVDDCYRALRVKFGTIPEPYRMKVSRLSTALRMMIDRSVKQEGWLEEEAELMHVYARSLIKYKAQHTATPIPQHLVETTRRHFVFCFLIMENEFKHRTPPGATFRWFPALREEMQPLVGEFLENRS